MNEQAFYVQVLRRAANEAGGLSNLARLMGISRTRLSTYLSGESATPRTIFLRATEVISESDLIKLKASPGPRLDGARRPGKRPSGKK